MAVMTPETPILDLDELWRATPHSYAVHASRGRWKAYRHLHYAATRIAQAIARGHGRIIVNMPPRMGKSELVSHWLPVWFLDGRPDQKVMLASYGDALATDFGRSVRNEFENNPACRTKLREDSSAANRFNTPAGGGMVVAGVGGPLSGRGFSLGLIDDPVKNWQDAHSHLVKQTALDWYHSTFYTRAEPGATIIIAMCMTGDTPVLLADGSSRNMAEIRQGATVASYVSGRLVGSKILKWANQGPDIIFTITLGSKTTVRANKRHPFLIERKGVRKWIRLKDLVIGDKMVRMLSENTRIATSLLDTEKANNSCWPQLNTFVSTLDPIVSIEQTGYEDVFDIQVEDTENFIANGLVSHNTRWTDDDIVGTLLEEKTDTWELIRLPALAEPGDPLGRPEGAALCPQRYNVDALKNIRKGVGTQVWDALYQQNPSPYGGGRLYHNFSAANVDPAAAVLRRDLPLQTAWDFNVDPGMHVLIGQYDNRPDMFNVAGEIFGDRMNVVGACQALRQWLESNAGWRPGGKFPWPELHVFGDATGQTGNVITSESCYDMVRKMLTLWRIPHRCRIPAANGPVRERIDTVNEALCDVEGRVHAKISPTCTRLIADFREMRSDVNGLEDKHDHALSHACLVGETLIRTHLGEIPMRDVKAGDKVMTRRGWRRVLWAGITKQTRELYTLTLADGKRVTGTGNHGVFVNGAGFVPLATLYCSQKRRGTKESEPCPRKKSRTEGTSTTENREGDTSAINTLGQAGCTDMYGLMPMDPSPKDFTSTTRTGTQPTMTCRILNVSWAKNTSESTAINLKARREAEIRCVPPTKKPRRKVTPGARPKNSDENAGSVRWPKVSAIISSRTRPLALSAEKHSIASQNRVSNPNTVLTAVAPNIDIEAERIMKLAHVSSAGNPLRSIVMSEQNAAVASVRVSYLPDSGQKDVYDISVDGVHEFFANGILVKNSSAFGYWSVFLRPLYGMPIKQTGGRVG
jgi:hypothetical protein